MRCDLGENKLLSLMICVHDGILEGVWVIYLFYMDFGRRRRDGKDV